MNLAGAARLARRLHRGEIDEAGTAYVDHLERVAVLVAENGGDEWQQMAGWLHGAGRTGLRPRDLAALGVPRRVVHLVDALAPRLPWEPAGVRAGRIRSCRGAPLVLRADVIDLARPEARAALGGRWPYWVGQYRDLLGEAGVPIPGVLLDAEPASRFVAAAPLTRLNRDEPGRWAAVRAAGAAGELSAAGPLIDAYLAAVAGDPVWAAGRPVLAGALSQIAAHRRHQADAGWVATLVSLAGHHDDFLRATAIRGLAGLAGHEQLIIGALSDDSPLVVDAALGSLPDTAGQGGTLARIAGRIEPGWTWPRRHAVRLLVNAGDPQARAVLVAALAVDGMGLGHDLLSLLARENDRSLVPVVAGQLRGGARGRAAAAFLLGELRASETIGDLAAALGDQSADLQVRLACIEALGKLADPGAVPVLAAAARHHLAWVRSSALTALSKIDHPDVVTIALAASEDFDPDVRERAVRILADRGGQDTTARLLIFCDGPLARVALKGRIRIADPRAVPALSRVFLTVGDRRVRDLAGRALARSASRAPGLYPTAVMTPAQVRAIAWVLGQIGDKASRHQLTHMLAHRDELVRARAAAALGKIADPDGAPGLRTALADISPRVRAAAASALGRLGVGEPPVG